MLGPRFSARPAHRPKSFGHHAWFPARFARSQHASFYVFFDNEYQYH